MKRATYQERYVHMNKQPFQLLYFLAAHLGREGQMQPRWITLPASAASCKERDRFRYKQTAVANDVNVRVTTPALCVCDGQCVRD